MQLKNSLMKKRNNKIINLYKKRIVPLYHTWDNTLFNINFCVSLFLPDINILNDFLNMIRHSEHIKPHPEGERFHLPSFPGYA